MFDLFTQGFRSLDRAQGGLGIGLAMVRTIAELHHGSVTVDSDGPGQGSCFTVAIPLACPVGHAGAVPALPASARPCAVLVIEDHVDANDILALLLRDAGHTVTQCFDGASGLRAGLNGKFDVVICDIGLPGLDGFQVVSALCADNAAARPCFIATSGYSDAIKRKHATEAGFDHYLIKPISMPALAHIMAQHCLRDVKAGS